MLAVRSAYYKHKSIHLYVIKRLTAVFLVLSVLGCTLDYYYGTRLLNEQVLDLALREARHFVSDEVLLLTRGEADTLATKTREHLSGSSFVVLEFYDSAKKRLVEITKAEVEEIEEAFNKLPHLDLFGDSPRWQTLEHNGAMYIRIALPLSLNDAPAGYFEGIYQVPSRALHEIRSHIVITLVRTVAVMFMATLVLYPVIINLNRRVLADADMLLEANIGVLESLGNAIAKRDSDTQAHNYRVTLYSLALGRELGLDDTALRELVKGAFLHDIGKIAISDSILLKPGKLTVQEFAVMKTHVSHGVEILTDYEWLKDAINVVAFHHERFDGSGYIKGLSGKDIPVTARVFCIVDVFDALTSKRPYKEPFAYGDCVRMLSEEAGRHFDPVMLEVFLALSKQLYSEYAAADEAVLREVLRRELRGVFG